MLDGIMGTLDQQVDDKKSMMRANPGMQGTVGKDLIGVMALQKLQKEKQAAANELMLAQQNNPATIKEQLENELAGMTQNEMTAQTAGIMNQRQQQSPQQQQRPQGIQQAARPPMGGAPMGGAPRPPMGGAPRPPMGGAPRPPMPQGAGIAGAPRPPMMAQGGIVGFYKGGATGMRANIMGQRELAGGDVLNSRIAGINARIKKLREDATAGRVRPEVLQREVARLEQQKQEVVKGAQAGAGREQETLGRRQSGLEAAGFEDLAADVGGKLAGSKRKTFTTSGTQIEQPPVAVETPVGKEEVTVETPVGGEVVDPNTAGIAGAVPKAGPQGDLASMLKEKMNTGPTSDQLGTIGKSQATDRLDSGVKTTLDSMAKGDPAAALKTAQAEGDTRYNKDYDVTGIKAKRQAQDDEMARQLTPDAQRQQRLRAVGTQLGGIAGARAKADNRTDARRMQMYKDSADNYAADMKANVEKLKAVDENAAKIMQQVALDRNTAVQVFGSLSIADQQAVTADLNRFQKQNEAAMNALLGGMKIESEQALMQSIQAAKDSGELTGYLQKITAEKSGAMDEYLASPEYMRLKTEEQAAARVARKASIDARFEKTETFIFKRLEKLGDGIDLSAFYEKDSGEDSPQINTSGLQDGDI